MITCKLSNFTNSHLSQKLSLKSNLTDLGFCQSISSLRKKCKILASIDRPRWNATSPYEYDHSNKNHKPRIRNGCSDEGERKVHCEVEVISWRERRIRAEICVNAGIESVWHALTDYERLADFIPNLICR